jgi:SAM-dependent methyltransferase
LAPWARSVGVANSHYVIRGGLKGRERLRVLARVMWPTTRTLLEPLVAPDALCLDAGCGGGDVSVELARLAPEGSVVGVDLDETKLAVAREEAAAAGLRNVEFRKQNVLDGDSAAERFDVVYARFLLSHLPDAEGAVSNLHARLEPGGVLIVEDVDTSAMFCAPPSEAFQRFKELYIAAVQARGADPNIGPRLPGLLRSAGLSDVDLRVVQPAGRAGDVKLLAPITFDAITDAVAAQRLASEEELARVSDELWAYAADGRTCSTIPRVVQTWGCRPG